MAGGKYDIDLFERVMFNSKLFRLDLGDAKVEIALDPMKPRRLKIGCSACSVACEHQGAALSLILEEKLSLGLSAPPPERVPMESLGEAALIKQAIADRVERAQKEKMRLNSMNSQELWTDYTITSYASGKSYRIALRGWQPGESFCSCPDFPQKYSRNLQTHHLRPWIKSGKNSKRQSGKRLQKSKTFVYT